jgi:hypothetical protein
VPCRAHATTHKAVPVSEIGTNTSHSEIAMMDLSGSGLSSVLPIINLAITAP